jgi:uncharacterized protein
MIQQGQASSNCWKLVVLFIWASLFLQTGCEGVMKYLILFAVLGFVWWKWRKRNQPSGSGLNSAPKTPQKMLVCVQCGVHFPEGDGLIEDGKNYCSQASCLAAREAGRR